MEREIREKLDLSLLHSLLYSFDGSPSMRSSMKDTFDDIALLQAFLMDPPRIFATGDPLPDLESLAFELGSFISSLDLKMVDLHMMADKIRSKITHNYGFGIVKLRGIKLYRKRVNQSSEMYPRTGQLEFVDHLVENLMELVKAKADSIGPLKFYIVKLKEELQFLCSNLMVMPEEHKEEAHLKDLKARITNYAYRVEYVIDAFIVRDIPIWVCMLFLPRLLQKFDRCKEELKVELGEVESIVNSILRSSHNITPIVHNSETSENLMKIFNHPGIISYLVRTWSVVSSYKERKKEVFLELLHNVSYRPDVEYDDKMTYTSDMSQDELEMSLYKLLNFKSYFVILEDVQDIHTLNELLRVLPEQQFGSRTLLTTSSRELALQCRKGFKNVLYDRNSEDHTLKSQTKKPTTDDDVVGFKEETESMLELLMRGPKSLHLLSIFGMPGLGKTTLARKLYHDLSVVNHFHARAWCNVSQVYETKQLLMELLGHIVQLSETIHHKDDVELAELLRKSLKGRRFIIVLDDMWSTGAWNDLRRCFPDDKNGSRIIFTTRQQQLASQAQSGSILQPLGYLSNDESWELLRKKLFEKETCPLELLEVGIQIVKRCKGLPIAVVLVAGVLAKTEKTKDQWTQISETLTSSILGDAKAHGQGIIELSYKHLPDYLKPCFLYFGEYLEDREVSVSKLIRLWIAEGFIRRTGLKTLEDIAEDCLMDLIGRSLVTVSQRKSKGGVKSCRVHDLIHEFCLTKAGEEFFLQQIHGYSEHFPSSDNYQDYGMDPNFTYSSAPIIYDVRRVCIYSKRNHFIMLKPSGPKVRSLMFLPASDTCPSHPYDISFISHNFKLLTILNLEDINIGDSFEAIDVLVQLRYLAVQGYVDCIPSSMSNLWNLETFLVKGLSSTIVKVPDAMWDMVKLRHVHINDSAAFELDPRRPENSSMLGNLQTFSTLILTYGGDIEKIMRRLQGIKKLKCIFLDSWDDASNCNKFPELGFLSHLLSLKVFYDGIGKYPCELNFPSNLKKLTLSNFRMPWNEISQLAKLYNLEILKLLSNAFEGERWVMEDEVFVNLKFLKLDTLSVVEWSASDDHFPHLEHLILNKCERLEEIPPRIGDVTTLEMIEVTWCKPSAAISARTIQEEQLEYGNKALKIHVHPEVRDL